MNLIESGDANLLASLGIHSIPLPADHMSMRQ